MGKFGNFFFKLKYFSVSRIRHFYNSTMDQFSELGEQVTGILKDRLINYLESFNQPENTNAEQEKGGEEKERSRGRRGRHRRRRRSYSYEEDSEEKEKLMTPFF
mgnify:CR=1 FL=1